MNDPAVTDPAPSQLARFEKFGDAALRVECLTKRYKGQSGPVAAVTDVSFEVRAGETVALLGPNGAGKTTLMKTASGLVIPDGGRILVNGLEPYSDASALRWSGSVLEGSRNLYWKLTPRENLAYFGVIRGMRAGSIKARTDQLLNDFDLLERENSPVQELSRGMQQKLAVACAILHEPSVLLLDEPTLGLDAASSLKLIAMIRALADSGMTVLLSTHQLDVAESLAHKIVIINHGRIVHVSGKDELIERFSRGAFVVRHEGILPPEKRSALIARFGGSIPAPGHITLPIEAHRLYEVLDLLRPLAITEITTHRASLTAIFLQLTGERIDDA
jgi:ABC-2 type transport system ATP-binding protein